MFFTYICGLGFLVVIGVCLQMLYKNLVEYFNKKKWKKVRQDYIKDMYGGDETKGPKVYRLDEKYKDTIK